MRHCGEIGVGGSPGTARFCGIRVRGGGFAGFCSAGRSMSLSPEAYEPIFSDPMIQLVDFAARFLDLEFTYSCLRQHW